jgi:hypothetical protein
MVVRDEAAGTSIKCPKCKESVEVSEEAESVRPEQVASAPSSQTFRGTTRASVRGPITLDSPMSAPTEADSEEEEQVKSQTRHRPCPYCEAALPLVGEFCPSCRRNIKTGKKMSALHRAKQISTAAKLGGIIGVLALVFVVVAVRMIVKSGSGTGVDPSPIGGIGGKQQPGTQKKSAEDLIRQWKVLEDPAEKRKLAIQISTHGDKAVAAVEKVRGDGQLSVVQAVVLLAEVTHSSAVAPLQRYLKDPKLSAAPKQKILLHLARLKDPGVLGELISAYFEEVRRKTLDRKWHAWKVEDNVEQMRAALSYRDQQIAEYRKAVVSLESAGLTAMLDGYWSSWNWVGTKKGDAWTAEIERVMDSATDSAGTDNKPKKKKKAAPPPPGEMASGAFEMQNLYRKWLSEGQAGSKPKPTPKAKKKAKKKKQAKKKKKKSKRRTAVPPLKPIGKGAEWLEEIVVSGRPNQQMAAAIVICGKANPPRETRRIYARIIGTLMNFESAEGNGGGDDDMVIRQRAVWTVSLLEDYIFDAWFDAGESPYSADEGVFKDAKDWYRGRFNEDPKWIAASEAEQPVDPADAKLRAAADK